LPQTEPPIDQPSIWDTWLAALIIQLNRPDRRT
jgi:hypothetical protein